MKLQLPTSPLDQMNLFVPLAAECRSTPPSAHKDSTTAFTDDAHGLHLDVWATQPLSAIHAV